MRSISRFLHRPEITKWSTVQQFPSTVRRIALTVRGSLTAVNCSHTRFDIRRKKGGCLFVDRPRRRRSERFRERELLGRRCADAEIPPGAVERRRTGIHWTDVESGPPDDDATMPGSPDGDESPTTIQPARPKVVPGVSLNKSPAPDLYAATQTGPTPQYPQQPGYPQPGYPQPRREVSGRRRPVRAVASGNVDLQRAQVAVPAPKLATPQSGTAASSTATGASFPPGADVTASSVSALRLQADADRAFIVAKLNNRRVAQLSSTRPGLVAEGADLDRPGHLRRVPGTPVAVQRCSAPVERRVAGVLVPWLVGDGGDLPGAGRGQQLVSRPGIRSGQLFRETGEHHCRTRAVYPVPEVTMPDAAPV